MALTDFFVPCVLLDKRTQPDGYGGITTVYTDGAAIKCGITTDNSTEAQIAYKSGLKTIYTIVFDKRIALSLNDRVKRVKDGKVFRVTSDSSDMQTPDVSAMQYAQVSAEVVSA